MSPKDGLFSSDFGSSSTTQPACQPWLKENGGRLPFPAPKTPGPFEVWPGQFSVGVITLEMMVRMLVMGLWKCLEKKPGMNRLEKWTHVSFLFGSPIWRHQMEQKTNNSTRTGNSECE